VPGCGARARVLPPDSQAEATRSDSTTAGAPSLACSSQRTREAEASCVPTARSTSARTPSASTAPGRAAPGWEPARRPGAGAPSSAAAALPAAPPAAPSPAPPSLRARSAPAWPRRAARAVPPRPPPPGAGAHPLGAPRVQVQRLLAPGLELDHVVSARDGVRQDPPRDPRLSRPLLSREPHQARPRLIERLPTAPPPPPPCPGRARGQACRTPGRASRRETPGPRLRQGAPAPRRHRRPVGGVGGQQRVEPEGQAPEATPGGAGDASASRRAPRPRRPSDRRRTERAGSRGSPRGAPRPARTGRCGHRRRSPTRAPAPCWAGCRRWAPGPRPHAAPGRSRAPPRGSPAGHMPTRRFPGFTSR
jgi:hypothetical protein